MSIQLKRLESLSLRELSIILTTDTKNKKLNQIGITEVRITRDLSFMTIFYTVLVDSFKEEAANLLEQEKPFIRHKLAAKINARKMPELIFKFDEALEYGNHINEVIKSLNIEHEEKE